jgi:hypothetical protein
MAGTIYKTRGEALAAARDSISGRKDLAVRGPGYVLVGEVRQVGGGYELRGTTVHAEHEWRTTPDREIVLRNDGSTCPVCGRKATPAGDWAIPGKMGGHFVGGLEPAECVGCWDTMST